MSLLQRSLGIGYGRGARLIDFMAEDGIVGAYNGSQAREVLITLEQWMQMSGQGDAGSFVAEPPKPRRSNKILIAPPSEDAAAPGEIRDVKPVDDEYEDEEYEEESDDAEEEEGSDEEYDEEDAEDDEPPFDSDDDEEDEYEDEEEDLEEDEVEDEQPKRRPPRAKGQCA